MEVPLSVTNHQGSAVQARLVAPSGWINVPVVVICRDRPSPEIEVQDRQLTGHLESEGIGVLLLDLSVLGGRPPHSSATSGASRASGLKECLADLSAVLDALRAHRSINPDRVGFFVAGRAGPTVMHLTAAEARIRALVLASSPVPPPRGNCSIDVPTLFITGAEDQTGRDGVHSLGSWLRGPHELRIIPRSDGLFSTPVAFSRVARDTVSWFTRYLGTGYQAMSA